jgi:CheY-like chemotaxis protein
MPRLRRTPLIVVTSATPGAAERVVERLRQDGAIAYATHSAEGCLRVSTSVGPDVILIDVGLPRRARSRLTRLLRAHPISAHAQLRQLADAAQAAGVERTAHLVAA